LPELALHHIPAARLSIYSCRSCHPVTKGHQLSYLQLARGSPPPTRTITFFVAVLGSPFAPARLSVVNLHVTIFLPNEFEIAYCARISSPSCGILLSGGSTRSISKPCAIELTIAATSASSGSCGLYGVYRYDRFAAAAAADPLPKSLSRDDGRDGVVRSVVVVDDVSRKLDGGSLLLVDGRVTRGLL